jgi:branched-chain amino acid transport system permease protein
MAVRDMDVAAWMIGVCLMRAKLLAFAVSSFCCGVAGALFAYAYLRIVESEDSSVASTFELMVFGALIIFFTIVEPHALARLWQVAKEDRRLWTFSHRMPEPAAHFPVTRCCVPPMLRQARRQIVVQEPVASGGRQ